MGDPSNSAPKELPQPGVKSSEEQAFDILREVQSAPMESISPKQLATVKAQELIRRVQSEIGMTIPEAEQLFGVTKGRGFSSLFQ